jgi:toxin ParE1/3/4
MTYTVSILAEAESDIDIAFVWYELKQPELGDLYFKIIDKSVQFISNNPFACQEVFKGIRRMVIKKFPYGIYYKVIPNKIVIQIIGVIHFQRGSKVIRNRI